MRPPCIVPHTVRIRGECTVRTRHFRPLSRSPFGPSPSLSPCVLLVPSPSPAPHSDNSEAYKLTENALVGEQEGTFENGRSYYVIPDAPIKACYLSFQNM